MTIHQAQTRLTRLQQERLALEEEAHDLALEDQLLEIAFYDTQIRKLEQIAHG